jgi:serine-protein kinase ATM
LSHVAFRLFESVSHRVKTLNWQKTGDGLQERRMAVGRSDELIAKARIRLQSIKKKDSQEFMSAEREVRELQIYRIHLEREINNAEEEREVIQSSIHDHRMHAMQSIVSALCLCGVDTAEDLSKYIFRLVSMWFSSDDEETWNESIGAVIKEMVDNVPTFRFVPLYPQLLSRLTCDHLSKKNSCQNLLQQLIYKMCVQHPYHCIVPLISVANGKTSSSSSGSSTKGDIATAIIGKIKKGGDIFHLQVTENYERLAAAYVHLAMADTKDFHRGNSSKIPMYKVCKTPSLRLDKCLVSGRREITCVPCILTKMPSVRPSCDYGGGMEDPVGSERIAAFESFFSVTEGGLHRPKIVTCIGSKGGRYRELVKGEDETRQDAVMEQVFTYVNSIMARQRNVQKVLTHVTRISTQSELNLVTYNIVPLSPLAGVRLSVNYSIHIFNSF